MKRHKSWVLVWIIICFLILLPVFSYAGIGAMPSHEELKGKPREKIKGSYTVYNTGDNPLDVGVYFREYFKLEENKKIAIKDWLHCRPMNFRLGPKEKKEVKYIVRGPERAVGEVMSMIFFSAPSVPGSNVRMSFGVSLYARIDGTDVVNGEINDVELKRVSVPSGGFPPYYAVTVNLDNKGNVHLRPRIKADLYKGRRLVKTVDFPFGWPVFPGQKYNYQGSWRDEEYRLKPGSYVAEIEAGFEGQVLRKKTAFFVDEQGGIFMKKVR